MTVRRVSAEAVAFAYRRARPVIGGATFEVDAGSVVGLLGRNGSGKTTLLRLVAKLLLPTSGRLSVAADRPAVVLDRTPFVDALTAGENFRATMGLRGQPTLADGAAESLAAFGLGPEAERPVCEFSLGMRRRLALAEVFAARSDLLLLDEPTLGLDPDGRARLHELLRTAAGRGAAALIATNDAAFAETASDVVLLLHDGCIVAGGPPDRLIDDLRAPTLLELELTPGRSPAHPPAGLSIVASGPGTMTLAGPRAERRVVDVAGWLAGNDSQIRALRVRAPDLADVFRAHTGHSLAGEAP